MQYIQPSGKHAKVAWLRSRNDIAVMCALIASGDVDGFYIGDHPEGAYIPSTLDELRDCLDVTHIGFGNNVPSIYFSELSSFKKLISFKCEEASSFDVDAFRELESISFFTSKEFDLGFSIPSLRHLQVHQSRVLDFSFINGFPKLEELVVVQASRLQNLHGIGGAKNLRTLSISYCPKLIGITDITMLQSLQEIQLCHLKNLTSSQAIFSLDKLVKLYIEKIPAIESGAAFKVFQNLNFLTCIDTEINDGDLEQILRIKTLRHCHIRPNKPHYQPKASVIYNTIKARS